MCGVARLVETIQIIKAVGTLMRKHDKPSLSLKKFLSMVSRCLSCFLINPGPKFIN